MEGELVGSPGELESLLGVMRAAVVCLLSQAYDNCTVYIRCRYSGRRYVIVEGYEARLKV